MKPYIFRAHNGVHIIDLTQTVDQLQAACNFLGNTIRGGCKILFEGTKKQAQPIIRELADTHKQHFVTDRWLGGMLTNLKTVKQRLKRLNEIEAMEEDGSIAGYVKQEQASIRREKQRLVKNLGGIRNMDSTPDAMFVVDIKREHNAIAEARKLRQKPKAYKPLRQTSNPQNPKPPRQLRPPKPRQLRPPKPRQR